MNHYDSFDPCAACFFFGLAPWLMGSLPSAESQPLDCLGIPCTIQDSGASLMAQLVKNLPAMQETPIRFLGREDPLEKR